MLTAEVTPKPDLASWTFTVEGQVEQPTTWTWDEIHALPAVDATQGDIHCVTTWSKFGVTFGGVSVDTLLDAARVLPTATHVLAFSHTGYTTNLPLADVTGGKAWVVWDYDGAAARRSSTAARPGCSCRTSTSGRAPSGSRACACSTTTSPASGNATATTTAATRGSSSATKVTDDRAAPRANAWQTRDGRRHHAGDHAREDLPARARAPVAAPRRASTTSCG